MLSLYWMIPAILSPVILGPEGKPHEGAALRRGERLGRRARPILRRCSSGDGSVPLRIADTRHRRVLSADTGDRARHQYRAPPPVLAPFVRHLRAARVGLDDPWLHGLDPEPVPLGRDPPRPSSP